jgi:WD40 repeat protein
MPRLTLTNVILVFSLFCFGQLDTKDAQIVLNPEGHRGKIKSLFFSKDGKKLYSVSDDKTICVWDVSTGNLINTIRGFRQVGTLGMLNSGTISTNGNFMAVGGMLGDGTSNTGEIRFIRPENGEVIYVSKGLQSPVTAISVAENNSYVAAGSNSGQLSFLNLENTKQKFTLKAHSAGIYAICFSPDNSQLITAGYDNRVVAWDLAHMLAKQESKYKILNTHSDKVRGLCYAPNGKTYYSVGYDNKIVEYSNQHEVLRVIDSLDGPLNTGYGDLHCVDISDDSKTLIVGAFQPNGINAISYDLTTGKRLIEFKGNNNTVMALDAYGNQLVATAGGSERDIFIWNPKTGKIKNHLVGKGKRLYKVGFRDDNTLAIGMDFAQSPTINNMGNFTHTFDLSSFTLKDYDADEDFSGEITALEGASIGAQSFQELKVSNGVNVSTIELDPGTQGNMFCYSLSPSKEVFVGSNYALTAYDLNGNYLREYRGHVSDVHSLAFSSDGRFMFSVSADQTVLIWDLNEKGKLKRTFEEFMVHLENLYGKERIDKAIAQKGIEAFKQTYNNTEKPEVFPIASLFISSEDDWIIWTRKNYYAASKKGARFVGFHYNQGVDSSALYYSFQQFDVVLNRPDKVLSLLGIADNETIELYEQLYQRRLQKLGLSVEQLTGDLQPPKIIVNTDNSTVYKSYFGFNCMMIDQENGIASTHASINGVPVFGKEGLKSSLMSPEGEAVSATVITNLLHTRLEPGLNIVDLWCKNNMGIRSNIETRLVFFDTAEFKPDLYVLGIGVSDYAQSDYDLKYAAKDVNDFVAAYQPEGTYENIIVEKILDSEATLENITAALDRLKKAKVHDHVVIYFAGHGVLTDDLEYYMASHDMNFEDPAENGLAYTLFEEKIVDLNSRNRVVFIDACHSGEVEKENTSLVNSNVKVKETRGVAVITTDAIQENLSDLVNNTFNDLRGNAGATIIASSGGSEFAYEGGKWQNGVFTYVVLSGLNNNAADLNGDGQINISELQEYVSAEVNRLTRGLQTPNARNENLLRDYIFWE